MARVTVSELATTLEELQAQIAEIVQTRRASGAAARRRQTARQAAGSGGARAGGPGGSARAGRR